MPTQRLLRRKALIVGIVISVLQVLADMAAFFMTGLKAMFSDFSFIAISAPFGMVAVYLSSRMVQTTGCFPSDMLAPEPICAICKAISTVSLLVYSLISMYRVVYDYFVFGFGEHIKAGPVVIYEILIIIVCFSLCTYYRHPNRSIGDSSTILTAKCKSMSADGSMSSGIGVVAISLTLLPADGPLDLLHYAGDLFIIAILAALTTKKPFSVLKEAFMELVGSVRDNDKTNTYVEAGAQRHLPTDTDYEQMLIFKTGMNYAVDVYLSSIGETIDIVDLIKCERSLEKELGKYLYIVDMDLMFD